MGFNINIINVLILSGIFQGIIISLILLFRNSDRAKTRKTLALALIAVFLHLIYLLLIDINLPANNPWILWIPWNFTTAIGPLLYLYIGQKTDTRFSPSKSIIKLFIPVFFEIALHIVQVGYCIKMGVMYYRTPLFIPIYSIIYLWAGVSIYYYLNKSIRLIKNHENWIYSNYSNLKNITLEWLLKLASYHRWIWVCWTLFIILLLVTFQHHFGGFFLVAIMYMLILGVTYLSYFLGLEALIHTQTIYVNLPKTSSSTSYSHLSEDKIVSLVSEIESSMKEKKLYRNDQISLALLANEIGVEPNLMSFILNTHIKQNFHDYINSHRIEEVKAKMIHPDFTNYKIVSIAYESGFNSKATFNRVFKKNTGMSPSDFIKHNQTSQT